MAQLLGIDTATLAVLAGMALLTPSATQAGECADVPHLVSRSQGFGRTWVEYEQPSDPAWGYPVPQTDHFWLSLPEKPSASPPLCVVLHSAGGNGREPFQPICAPHHERGTYGDASFYVLCLDCARNRSQDWWWGLEELKRRPQPYSAELVPTEKRVLATIAWAVREFKIDPNRIYLSGISMGGSGTLGIGLNHGDIFAAISVVVPAGIEHMQARLHPPLRYDPPPLVNVSSHLDSYARGQEQLLEIFAANRYALVFAWEPFGHAAVRIAECHPSVYDTPWLTIRRNEAYPVFTRATTDQNYPGWNDGARADQRGQINGWFRWKTLEDSPNSLAMELRLVNKKELRHSCDPPGEAITAVTFRRLQRFALTPGQTYQWSISAEGEPMKAGSNKVDVDGLAHLDAVHVTERPVVVRLTR
jgi:predicted esterase